MDSPAPATDSSAPSGFGIPWVLISAGLCSLLLAATLHKPQFLAHCYALLAVPALFLIGTAFAWTVVRDIVVSRQRRRWRVHVWGLGVAAVLTALVIASVPPRLRVLGDEAELLSVSRAMFLERTVDTPTMGFWEWGEYNPIHRKFPKRPLLFPFLVNLVHGLRDYRVENTFVVNGALLFLLLAFSYRLLQPRIGRRLAAASLPLLVAQPLVSLVATSGGFDLLMVVALLGCLVLTERWWSRPSAPRRDALTAGLLLLVHTRYEAVLFALLLALVAWSGSRGSRGPTRHGPSPWNSPSMGLVPLGLLLAFWQRAVVTDADQLEVTDPSTVAQFSMGHLMRHGPSLLTVLFQPGTGRPFAIPVMLAATVSLILWWRSGDDAPSIPGGRRWILLDRTALAFTAIHTLLMLTYFQGDALEPASSRLYAPLIVAGSLCAARGLARSSLTRGGPGAFFVITVSIWLYHHPLAVRSDFMDSLHLPREYEAVMRVLGKHRPQDVLVVARRATLYTINEMGAIHFQVARSWEDGLHAFQRKRIANHIYVVQEIDEKSLAIQQDAVMPASFVLDPVEEVQIRKGFILRISRVRSP